MDTKLGNLQNEEAQLGCIKGSATAGHFLQKKAKSIRSKEVDGFVLDKNGILQKLVKLKYTIEPTIVLLRKLTFLIIIEFHNGKGYQGISCMMNMIRYYFWWMGMCRDVHQHINSCQLCIQFLPNRLYTLLMHLEIPKVPFAGCSMDYIGPLPTTSKGNRHILTFMCLLTFCLIMVPLKNKTADEVLMVYIKDILPKTYVLSLSYKAMVQNLKMTN